MIKDYYLNATSRGIVDQLRTVIVTSKGGDGSEHAREKNKGLGTAV
jgi:hypothetical protein